MKNKNNINGNAFFNVPFWDYLRRSSAEGGIPIHGHFELTPICNLKCKMCYVQLENDININKKMLTFEQWKVLIDEAIEMGMLFASLTGGECLTNPLFKEIYMYLQSKGVMIFVLTNGVLLDLWVDFFKKHPPKLIQVSIYGKDEETYEKVTGARVYKKVKDNIELAIMGGLPVSVTITPSKYLTKVFDIAKYYKEKNISVSLNQYLIKPKENTGRYLEDFNLTFEEKIKITDDYYKAIGEKMLEHDVEAKNQANNSFSNLGLKCSAGRSDFTIGWSGDMYMCVALDIVTGKPLLEGLKKAWKNTNDFACNVIKTPIECLSCKDKNICNLCPGQHYYNEKETKFLLNKGVCQETKNIKKY